MIGRWHLGEPPLCRAPMTLSIGARYPVTRLSRWVSRVELVTGDQEYEHRLLVSGSIKNGPGFRTPAGW